MFMVFIEYFTKYFSVTLKLAFNLQKSSLRVIYGKYFLGNTWQGKWVSEVDVLKDAFMLGTAETIKHPKHAE